jgi:hypothetical protein
MLVNFERSGGFAGLHLKHQVDVSRLNDKKKAEFEAAIDRAKFFDLPTEMLPKRPLPDLFNYKLSVKDRDKEHQIIFSDETITPELKPLVSILLDDLRKD